MTYVTDKKTKRVRKLRPDTKYDPKFAEELLSGIRYKKKLSIPELCRKWRITRQTYWRWREQYQEFSDAAELAELDYAAYWMELNRSICEGRIKGNAQLVALNLAHVDQVNMTQRLEIASKEETISTININVVAARPLPLEHKKSDNIIDILPENVVKLPAVIDNDKTD
jgi:transposase-like protein